MRGGRGGGKEGNSLREIALKCKEGGEEGRIVWKREEALEGRGGGLVKDILVGTKTKKE